MTAGGDSMKKTIRAVLREPEYDHTERLVEVVYDDPELEVYSYEIGDGIWGTYYGDFDEMKEALGIETADKWVSNDYEDMVVELPLSFVYRQGYSIISKKTQKPLRISEKDMQHMCCDSVITLPDGSVTELDGEGSPLMDLGLI